MCWPGEQRNAFIKLVEQATTNHAQTSQATCPTRQTLRQLLPLQMHRCTPLPFVLAETNRSPPEMMQGSDAPSTLSALSARPSRTAI